MITRKQFCEIQIDEFCRDLNIPKEELNDNYVYRSSTLAVCMEYLGMLKSEEAKEYTASRGGHMFTYANMDTKEVEILSTREFIDLLPKTLS